MQRFVLLLLLVAISSSRADLPSVRFDRIFPLGGAVGTTVEVEVQGADIEEVKTLLFDHPGLKAMFRQDRRFKITIAADVPAGTYDIRLVGRFGISNPRLFAVTRGLLDVAEKEPNDDAATAQKVPLNVAINGQSDGNRDDVYRFPAKKGQRITLTCQATKLDSTMDANLILTTADGKPLAANGDYHGRDPFLDFVAPTDGEYLVTVHDLTYRGGLPYRLMISDLPQLENVFPRAVQAGKRATLSLLGRNLGSKSKPSPWTLFDLPLDEDRLEVTAPADVSALGAFRFIDHPTDHSVLPTAATCTLRGFQVRHPASPGGDAVPVLVSDIPVTLEQEPNDSPDTAQKITLPAVVSGRFDKQRDADWYEFTVAEAGNYSFEVYSERIGGRADPYLVLTDTKGNRIAEMDDFGHRINAFDGHLRDPSGQQNLAAKTTYRVLVQDRYQRGGARYQYVLSIRKAEPDFFVAVIHSQNPGPAGLTIRRGGAAYLDVVIHYAGGFSGPITLTAEGLPPGVHMTPATIIGNTHGTIVLDADESAADWAGTVKLFATAKVGERTIRREVRPYTRVWSEANIATSRPTRELGLAVRETAPYALSFVPERLELEAGKKAEVKLKLNRRWPDFKSKVNVQALAFPGNIRITALEVGEGKDEATLTLDVQAGSRPGEYTLAVAGQAQVPFSKDTKATTKPPTLVTLPARPLTLIVTPAKK
jgi:hypothetical protein